MKTLTQCVNTYGYIYLISDMYVYIQDLTVKSRAEGCLRGIGDHDE